MCDRTRHLPETHLRSHPTTAARDAIYVDLDQVASEVAVELAASDAARRVAVGNVLGNPNAATLLADHGWEVRHRRGDSAADVELAAVVAADLAGASPPGRAVVVSGDRDLTPLSQIAATHGVRLTQRPTCADSSEPPRSDDSTGPDTHHAACNGSRRTLRGWERQMRDIVAAQKGQTVTLIALGQLLRKARVARPNGKLSKLVADHPELVLEGAHPHQRVRLARSRAHDNSNTTRGDKAAGAADAGGNDAPAGAWQRYMRDVVAASNGESVPLTDLGDELRSAGVKRPDGKLSDLVANHPELVLEGTHPHQRARLAT